MKTTAQLERLKSSAPFSQRLNDFIIERVKDVKFISNNWDELEFEEFKLFTQVNGFMPISNQFCDNTIFGDPEINIMFRAWHDSIHLELNEDFSPMAEVRVAFKQISELPEEWLYERQLILMEVAGQVAYNDKHNGAFPENQREFTINLIANGTMPEPPEIFTDEQIEDAEQAYRELNNI